MLLILAGCETVSSPDVANAELYAEVLVSTDGAVTQVDAKLQEGQGLGWKPVEVGGDEALVAVVGDEEAEMEPVDLGLGNVAYTATFESASGDEEAGARFDRTADDPIETFVTVPPDFTITAPTAGTVLPGDTAAVVTWDAAWGDGTVNVTFAGDCIPGWEITSAEDVGYAEIPAEALAADGASCVVTVAVVREARGELPEAWGAGGLVVAQSGRVVSVAVGG